MPNILKKTLTLVIAIGSITCSSILIATAPTAEVTEQVKTILPVHAVTMIPENFTPVYEAFGRVEAKHKLTLTSQVEGELLKLHPSFIEGGSIEKDTLLYQINDNDFQHKVNLRQGELKIAKANLALELGEQTAAKHEYQQLNREFKQLNYQQQKQLMLRQPQLTIAQSNVDIAFHNLQLAESELAKTSLTVDKNYVVTKKLAHKGDFVAKGSILGELVDLAKLRISIALPNRIASKIKRDQAVTIITQDGTERITRIAQIPTVLKSKSQLQQVYLEIENHANNLILGEFVEAKIQLPMLEKVLRLPHAYIVNNEFWLVTELSTLEKKSANILWQNDRYVFIENSLSQNEKIVSSRLSTPLLGTKVKIIKEFK